MGKFKSMVSSIRRVEQALGQHSKILTEQEMKRRDVGRRTAHAFGNISKGDTLTMNNIRLLRPGDGLPIKYLNEILPQFLVMKRVNILTSKMSDTNFQKLF